MSLLELVKSNSSNHMKTTGKTISGTTEPPSTQQEHELINILYLL